MNSNASSTQPKHRREDQNDDRGQQSEPSAKRRARSRSPGLAPATETATSFSIFGGASGGNDVAEEREGEGSGSGAGLGGLAESAEREEETAMGMPVQETAVDRLFSDRIVTVLVGPSQTTWRLHENLLSSSSDFFRSAFNSAFREAREDKLHLPEDDPAAFELFVRWLYARALSPTAASSLHVSPPPPIQTWLRLYALTCKLMVEDLENICVGAAWRHYSVGTRRPDIRDVQFVYENTPPGCGMRRLLRERLALGMFRGRQNNPVTAEWREVLNETPDLGFDIVNEVSGFHWISGGNAPARTGSEECVFHRHEKGEACRPG